MIAEIFKFYSVNIEKLKAYGFEKHGERFQFKTKILDGMFDMLVFITSKGEVTTKVVDSDEGEEYVLHLMDDSVGEFVGKVKLEFVRVLTDIRDNCYDSEIFKLQQSKEVIEYISKKYGDKLEFLWEKTPADAIWRRSDNKKWYGIILALPMRKLGFDSDKIVEIIDLRIDPEKLNAIVDNKNFFRGYHMNKKRWFTIILDGRVKLSEIFDFIDESYILAGKK